MSRHKILKIETITDRNGEEHKIAKVRSAWGPQTMWTPLDEDGNIDLPFGTRKAIINQIMGSE